MKIAVFADIHANLPALEAVLDDARRQGASEIWNLGDVVGYGAWPDQVVQRLEHLGAVSILGNYDRKVLKFPRKRAKWMSRKSPGKFTAFQWAWQNLSESSRSILRSLPRQRRLEVAGWRITLTHASVADDQEGIGEDISVGRLRKLAKLAEADLIVAGHTHSPFDTCIDNVRFVTAGSVGRPEGDRRACWCLLTIRQGQLDCEHRFVEYDIDAATEELARKQLPEEFGEMLRRGMSLDEVVLARAVEADHPETARSCEAGCACRDAELLELGQQCHFDQHHAETVTRLALSLFDQLKPLHDYTQAERDLLCAAGMLHDIGWIRGRKQHHKTSRDLILAAKSPAMKKPHRRLVAAIARYHRRSLPSPAHKLYGALEVEARQFVCYAGGMLRMADGLDRTHAGVIADVQCRIVAGQVVIRCFASGPAEPELRAAAKKSDLLTRATGRQVVLELADASELAATGWAPTNGAS